MTDPILVASQYCGTQAYWPNSSAESVPALLDFAYILAPEIMFIHASQRFRSLYAVRNRE